MSKDNYRKIGELLRYIRSEGCCAAGVESRWHQVFNIVLRDLGFTRKQRSFMWGELMYGNWDRLHLTDEEKAKPSSEFLDDFYYDVLYCSDRWSLDRLMRCHWLYRAYRRTDSYGAQPR